MKDLDSAYGQMIARRQIAAGLFLMLVVGIAAGDLTYRVGGLQDLIIYLTGLFVGINAVAGLIYAAFRLGLISVTLRGKQLYNILKTLGPG